MRLAVWLMSSLANRWMLVRRAGDGVVLPAVLLSMPSVPDSCSGTSAGRPDHWEMAALCTVGVRSENINAAPTPR